MEEKMIVTICIGSSCHLKGSREVVLTLQQLISKEHLESKIELNGSFCMNNCVRGVSVQIEDNIFSLTPDNTEEFFYKELLGRIN